MSDIFAPGIIVEIGYKRMAHRKMCFFVPWGRLNAVVSDEPPKSTALSSFSFDSACRRTLSTSFAHRFEKTDKSALFVLLIILTKSLVNAPTALSEVVRFKRIRRVGKYANGYEI